MRAPDTVSKVLASLCLLIFALCIGLSAYLVSVIKDEIDDKNFTVSQSLAFGNKYAMVILLVLSFGILGYLTYYRGGAYLFTRLLLVLVISSLIITLIWITTFYSKMDHYILAGIIFISALINITLTSNTIYNELKIKTKTKKNILILITILALIGFIGLGVSKINIVEDKVVQLFPSFENYMILVQGASILTLGFI
jgi:hypothetical protein